MNTINSALSFGKKVVGKFKVKRTDSDGKSTNIPVQVVRLDKEDYSDCFTYQNLKNINMRNFFISKQPKWDEFDYVVEKKSNGKILGMAECRDKKGELILDTIGTTQNPRYKGLGRVLLAGIAKDIKGKYPELLVPTALPDAYGFYDKCHFDYDNENYTFFLEEQNFKKLIRDAKKH
ncbi:hypothetical protein IKQ26_03265 [bacterium]|nr:hypothetical protein [bacterium]